MGRFLNVPATQLKGKACKGGAAAPFGADQSQSSYIVIVRAPAMSADSWFTRMERRPGGRERGSVNIHSSHYVTLR